MQTEWNLDALYTSFDSEVFQRDWAELKREIERIKQWAVENLTTNGSSEGIYSNASDKIATFIETTNALSKYYLLAHYANLVMSVETENVQAIKYVDVIEEALTELSVPTVQFERYVAECPDLDALIPANGVLREHVFFLHEIKENGKYRLSDKEEMVIAKMVNTGSNAWAKMKEQLASLLMVDIMMDGEAKKLPLSVVRNLAEHESGEVRKKAYEAELGAYPQIERAVCAALNGVKGEVLTLCKLRGYESPLEMTIKQARLTPKALDAMLSAIHGCLPAFVKYFQKKAELLGHQNGLPFYELFAPIGGVNLHFTYDEAASYVVRNFADFSQSLGDYAQYAFDNAWIDVYPREGKRGGAFCENLHPIKQSRFMTNFSGSFGDVMTLAHELGHGYHGHCLNNETYANSEYTMPIAETASTLCEIIMVQAALKTSSREEAFVILENHIQGAAQVIVDIYSRFLFEDELFKRRANGSLSVDELKEIMQDSQRKAYGDGLDHSFLHPYMWACKPHYYFADHNYYNFPYAYGHLFALGLYGRYLDEGIAFIKHLDDLLAASGKNNLVDVAKLMDIDVEDEAFWISSLRMIERDIDKFVYE